MKITRARWIVVRANRSEVWCGQVGRYGFRPINSLGEVSVKTYRTKKQAESTCSAKEKDWEVIPVIETIKSLNDVKEGV